MDTEYKTVKEYSQSEFIEKKSRFIGSIMPVKSESEALEFIAQKKKQYWDATHNVYAYIIRDTGTKRCSDDGEPQGTAGKPVLEILEREALTDICVVATRYFGGIMLGAGGLVRAYAHTAKIAVQSAQIMNMAMCSELLLDLDYSLYGNVSYILPKYNIKVSDTDFGETVRLKLIIRKDREQSFTKELTEITNGRVLPQKTGEKFEDLK